MSSLQRGSNFFNDAVGKRGRGPQLVLILIGDARPDARPGGHFLLEQDLVGTTTENDTCHDLLFTRASIPGALRCQHFPLEYERIRARGKVDRKSTRLNSSHVE